MKCHYGCGTVANFILKNGKACCSEFVAQCRAVRIKISSGLSKAHKRGVMKSWSHEDRIASHESHRQILQTKPFYLWGTKLRRDFVLQEQNYRCLFCKLKEWRNRPLSLQIDHIDGNTGNNTRENLRALCPNCHSQTETFCGKNINSGHKKISDDELYNAMLNSNSIAAALKQVGLAPKGGNYSRVKRLQLERSLGNL